MQINFTDDSKGMVRRAIFGYNAEYILKLKVAAFGFESYLQQNDLCIHVILLFH